ncbi:hypothetical protein J2W28_002429 [Variovorax boronicumulans]|nr:hypothetical protein [Variovorax boronicumulans]MDP9991354.1 hypothetical protein [Variovorax boronicumulans]MDQ0003282.1 hypothetical protein [Variovorax boronicumulans]MDQ0041325.1 hypothetical protein [Variovorax boronicumulans]
MNGLNGLNGEEGGTRVSFPSAGGRKASFPVRGADLTPMHPFSSVEGAIAAIDALDRGLREFELSVSDSLQDYLGVQMAQITDRALARGWEPISFMQKNGFRRYRFKAMRRP